MLLNMFFALSRLYSQHVDFLWAYLRIEPVLILLIHALGALSLIKVVLLAASLR